MNAQSRHLRVSCVLLVKTGLFFPLSWDRKRQRTGNNALDFFEYVGDAYLEQVRIHGGNLAEYKETIDRLRKAIKARGNPQWRQSVYGDKLDKLQNKHGQFNWEAELRDLTNMLDVPQNIPIKPIPTGTPPVVQPWEDQSLLPQPAPAPTPTAITPSVAPVVDSIGSHHAGGVIHGVNGDVLVNDHGRGAAGENRPLFSSQLWDRKRQRMGTTLDFFEYVAAAYLEEVRVHGGNVAEYKRTIDRLRNAINQAVILNGDSLSTGLNSTNCKTSTGSLTGSKSFVILPVCWMFPRTSLSN